MLICTSNFSIRFHWRSLTDEQLLALLRDLSGDDSIDNETRSDIDIYKDYQSFWHQESSIWTVWSFCQSWSSTGIQCQQQSSRKCSQKRFYCLKFWLNCIDITIYLTYLSWSHQCTQDSITLKSMYGSFWSHSAVLGRSNSLTS